MKPTLPFLLAAAVAAPTVLAVSRPVSKISFAPAEGASVTKTFTSKMELTLEDMSMNMNGEPFPMEFDMDMDMNHTQTVVVSDEYAAMREGLPARLVRSFDELGGNSSMSMRMNIMGNNQEQDMSAESSSELEGKKVVFAWNADAGEYKATFPEEGDEDLLENLEEDMDLRELLPAGEVAEGDEWQISPKSLRSILAPGGDLKLEEEESADGAENPFGGMGGGMDSSGSLEDWLGDDIEGTATGKFTGTRDVDGVTVAVIELKFDIRTAADLTDLVVEAMDEAELPQEMEMEMDHVDIEFEFEAAGSLLWNLSAGHFHSFELSGRMRLLTDTGMSMSAQGQDMSIENTVEMVGTLSQSARAE